jgi:hypothetical protein
MIITESLVRRVTMRGTHVEIQGVVDRGWQLVAAGVELSLLSVGGDHRTEKLGWLRQSLTPDLSTEVVFLIDTVRGDEAIAALTIAAAEAAAFDASTSTTEPAEERS